MALKYKRQNLLFWSPFLDDLILWSECCPVGDIFYWMMDGSAEENVSVDGLYWSQAEPGQSLPSVPPLSPP